MALRADWLPALAAFEAAARHQNFAHAAEELHLTASAVSHHVRKLESRLGVSLFQRHARGVALTAQGRQLADAAGTALADVDGVLRSLRLARDERDRVRITTLHSLAYTWLLPRLPEFTREHPHIQLSVDTEIALTRFDDGGPDLGIRHGAGHWPGLTAHLLMEDALFPVTSPHTPGAQAIVEAAQIAELPLIADHARQGWHDWFRAAGVHGRKLEERYTFSDTTDALMAAAHGLGAALAREQIVVPYLRSGQLMRLPGPKMAARWAYYAIYPAHRRLRPAARTFLEWLLAVQKD
ncbi:LysR substrate-binding domain-containing protein [Lysobacter enzymogenes]|jgi:DNA-binding transcriptional LysR family regulator|uniref:LysR substrate-binding domain-containing protein n=1 Tax=Lysobacter enzymogenes TaxID=69 RepID=UPI00089C48F2|nr:LysR substrate-binding domain-containing protein [Lysobacter enzymogenes]SDW57069.1 DNA-binding transcriptional regulator, LysR family [Lysobacter enzymogenes]